MELKILEVKELMRVQVYHAPLLMKHQRICFKNFAVSLCETYLESDAKASMPYHSAWTSAPLLFPY